MSDVFDLQGSIKLNSREVLDGLSKVDKQVDATGNSMEKLEGKSGKVGKVMGGLGKSIAGALSINVVKNFAMDCVKGLDDIYRSNAKLEAIFKSTGKATQSQIEELKEYATTLEGVGVVDDDVTKTGMAQLATFNLTSDSIKTLSSSMLDLIVNQKGVNATQEDAMGIANLVGKVMTGNTSALSRYGITLSEAQEKVLKMGTEQERAAMLAEVLGQNLGGVNEAIANTPEGKYKQMQMSLDGMKDTLGEALLPMILKVVEAITAMAQWFGNLSPTMQKVILVGGLVVAFLPGLIAMLSGLATVAGACGISFTAMALPILAIIAVIGAVIAVGVLLYQNWDTIKEKASQLGNWIGEKWNNIKEKTSETWNNMKETTSQAWSAMQNKIEEHGGGIKGVVGLVGEGMKKSWGMAFDAMDNATGGKLSDMANKVSEGLNKVKDFFSNLRLSEIKIPHIKLPHIGVTGEFSLKPPRIPKFNVDWYSSGAIFNKKTILPNGLGFGDANKGQGNNPEAVIPVDNLRDMIKDLLQVTVIINVDGREFTRTVVAPHQEELDKYNTRNPRLAY
ncbi:hypothetical protein GCM10008908_09080 [Clostridium subterminale]|uniref:Phage tail tape measure protein n=1 Tax=Clostridium subterminale TaxID=1550 RepID=A0ABN1KJC8_CLOSU